MNNKVDIQNLLDKVKKVTVQKELDLSSGEDLSIGIMNLISIEEHLFYTSQKTADPTSLRLRGASEKYLDLINEIRSMRTELMKEIIKDYEGEVWCISKHLLAASMRIMEVGTKELKKAEGAEPAEAEKQKLKAWGLFDKSYKLYSLFWGLNLKVVDTSDIKEIDENVINKHDQEKRGFMGKLGVLVKKVIDCCIE